ncbi:MAG: hypothetical protein EOL86_12870 [Deltaproteobacteria bacterium]|nr:hypothetical protein [Deltaproteobacteria bacterium]
MAGARPTRRHSRGRTGAGMSDIATLDDAALETLRQEIVTEQARRLVLTDGQRIVEQVSAEYESAVTDQPAEDWATISARTDRVGPGVRVTLDGIEYRNKSGTWLNTATVPDKDMASIWWERITPMPSPTAAPWSATTEYKPGDRCTRNGRLYECLVAHGVAYAGTWGPPTVGVWKDIGPA